jgi:hypothetical protein
MNNQTKKALIKKLSDPKNFDVSYGGSDSEPNRRWFVEKVVSQLQVQGFADDQIEEESNKVLAKSKALVAEKKGFRMKLVGTGDDVLLGSPLLEFRFEGRRAEILYGAIAEDILLADAGSSDPADADTSMYLSKYLDFIAARRYRSVQRMELWVNPNDHGYMRYPTECEPDAPRRVNFDASGFWQTIDPDPRHNPDPDEPVPIGLKPNVEPVEAIDKLWTKKKEPCRGNLFDCSSAMCIVLMDSLREARDPAIFLNVLIARGGNFLRICNPNFDEGEHFLWDHAGTAVFTKDHFEPGDIQVGDHVYIWNHGLYRRLVPRGDWRGEHAVLADCGNRSFADAKGFAFTGHGFKQKLTVHEIYDELLRLDNMLLHRAFVIGSQFLDYKATGEVSVPPDKVAKEQHDIGGTLADIYNFDIDYEFDDNLAPPDVAPQQPKMKDHGFVIVHQASRERFWIPPASTIGDAVNWGTRRSTVFVRRDAPPAGRTIYDPVLWYLEYQHVKDFGTEPPVLSYFPLFAREKNRLKVILLKRKEMPKSPLGKLLPGARGAIMTRPTVMPDNAMYRRFLTNSGAL